MELHYVWEDTPLGTAGALTRVDGLDEPFLAMNGDVLTTLDYAQLMRFHKGHEGGLTIATHQKTVDIDLGVIESEDGFVREYIEKPTMRFEVSMGVYVYDPDVVELIPPGHFDFPDVVHAMLETGRKVAVYTGFRDLVDIGTAGELGKRNEIEAHPGALQGCLTGRFPLTETVTLPLFPTITEEQIGLVVDTIASSL